MARLPIPGSDDGKWGNLLNEFLSVEFKGDGTLKRSAEISAAITALGTKYVKPSTGIPTADIADGAVSEDKLAAPVITKLNAVGSIADASVAKTKLTTDVQTSLTRADSALQSIDDGTITEVKLSSSVQTKLNNVGSGTIADGSITDIKISATAAIAQSKVANLPSDLATKYVKPGSGIPEADLASAVRDKLNAGGSGTIADGSITTSKLQDAAVFSSKLDSTIQASLAKADTALQSIADGSITEVKLASAVQTKLNQAGAIADDSISTAKLQAASVTSVKLAADIQASLAKADSALQSVADNTITNAEIVTNASIDQSKIANLSTDLSSKISTTQIGIANGVAGLDATGQLQTSQIIDATIVAAAFSASDAIVAKAWTV